VGINQELKLQNKMLNDLDRDIDEAAEKMNFVMGKVSRRRRRPSLSWKCEQTIDIFVMKS